ncbi:DUF6223 family protein [Streptomyces sp. NPDC058735]|uniref:DUF6223 family protein n=1 Tax=unclassified Streptomyces TaxID=2593676 RepID=UPI00369DC301
MPGPHGAVHRDQVRHGEHLETGRFVARARAAGRTSGGDARTAARSALVVGLAGTALAVLHLATSSGGPGTGNGRVGAVVAVPLGPAAVAPGRRVLTRSLAGQRDGEGLEREGRPSGC